MATPDAPSQPICALGVSERTLSALRDDAMSRAEAARLAVHVESCPACSARLSAFDDLAARLRSERPPEPGEDLWQAIATAAGSSSYIRRLRLSGMGPTHPSWSRLSALAAVLLLTIGFVALFGLHRPAVPVQRTPTATPAQTFTPAPTATSLPTATPALLPAHPLTWHPVSAPSPEPIAFADDGESAYSCSVGSDAQGNGVLHIWRTSDRGAHWIPAREVPTFPDINGCELVVDASDPSVAALAWAPRGGGVGDSYTGLMTTVDGGVTWQTVPSQPFIRIDQLDSRSGVIYALRETADNTNSVAYHLWASSDRMRSWHQVDQGLSAAVAGFWLQPEGSGILLVESGGADLAPTQLWSSPDGGTTWHLLDVPSGLPSYRPERGAGFGVWAVGIVARSLNGQFHICVSNVLCSTDGGKTWHARTTLLLATAQGSSVALNLVGITDDGTLLASGSGTLYRLAASSDHWQSLGPLPHLAVTYCPSPGAGILWASPAAIGDTIDPQGRIFATSYTP